MNLDTLTHFIQMGGYGSYVWSAYFLTLMMLVCSYGYARSRFQKSRRLVLLMPQGEDPVVTRTVTFKPIPLR